MIKIENTEVFGWEAAIRGMRNPMNSWDKSDSHPCWSCSGNIPSKCHLWGINDLEHGYPCCKAPKYIIGENDLKLMKSLSKAGSDHGKFLRMINVTCDIVAPLYWYKEFDTYKVGTVANSCSTMHKIHAKEFTFDDFSCEHLIDEKGELRDWFCDIGYWSAKDVLHQTIMILNFYRSKYIKTNDKKYWWQMIQLLPSSYNQRRTVQMNYQVLKSMYHARKNHKLDCWIDFCRWAEGLPYFKEICMDG